MTYIDEQVNLVINKMTSEQYETAKQSGLVNENELYITDDDMVIPTKTSDLTNDSGFITEDDIPEIPTKTSDLTNDSGFLTGIPTTISVSQITSPTGEILLQSVPIKFGGPAQGIKITGSYTFNVNFNGSSDNMMFNLQGNSSGSSVKFGGAGNGYTHNGQVGLHSAAVRISSPMVLFQSDSRTSFESGAQIDFTNATVTGLPSATVSWNDITGKPTIPTKTSDLTNDSGFVDSSTVDAKIATAIGTVLNTNF